MESKRLKILVCAGMQSLQALVQNYWFVGSRGDVMPGVGLCKALEERGHEAAFGVTPGPEADIRAYGVRCITLGATPFKLRDETAVMSDKELTIIRRSMNPRELLEVERKHSVSWNLDDCMPESLRACRDLLQKEHFDVIVATVITQLAALRLRKMFPRLKIVRTAFSFGSFAPPTRAFPPGGYTDSPQCYGFLNKLKHYHFIFCRFMPFILQASHAKRDRERTQKIEGIDHNDGFGMFKVLSDLPMLGLWSEHLQPTPSDFPENLLVTGCIFTPKLESWKPSEALEAFMQKRDGHGRKPAIITFGSMMGVQNVQEGTQKALQQMGMNVVKFVNKTSMQSQRSEFSFTASSSGQEAAPDVFEIDYAPFDWLLPKSSVVICHGGAGTTFRSLWSGVPVVICPIISALICDQVSHGQFVERKGLGTWIESLAPSVAECVTAIEQALTCEQRCREVGAKLQQEDGAAAAAAAVERVVLKQSS